jgi:hypothetical protein
MVDFKHVVLVENSSFMATLSTVELILLLVFIQTETLKEQGMCE